MSRRSARSWCPTTGTSSTWSGSVCSPRSTSSSDLAARIRQGLDVRFLNRSAGRLSRHRRGPLAGILVLLLGLLLTGGLYTVFSPAQAQETQADEELVAQGRE